MNNKAHGTVERWVWSELEPTYGAGYLLGTLATDVQETDASPILLDMHPLPAGVPARIYFGGEMATVTAVSGNELTITRTTPRAHQAGTIVQTDSYHAVARDYSIGQRHTSPLHFGRYALTLCEFSSHYLAAAKQDPRLIVLPGIRSAACIPAAVAAALSNWGITPDMTVYGMLEKLSELEPAFLQED